MEVNTENEFENIKLGFKEYFKDWGPDFPSTLNEFGFRVTSMKGAAWVMRYSIDYDRNDLPEMSIIAHERHHSDIKIKICNNGEIISLTNNLKEIFNYSGEDRMKNTVEGFDSCYFRRIGAYDIISGCISPSISVKYGFENIFNQGILGTYQYNKNTNVLHPDYQRAFRYKGRIFNSISHCMNFYKTYYSLIANNQEVDRAKILESAKKIDLNNNLDFLNDNSVEWLEKKVRIVFEAQMKLAIQHKDILFFLLDKVSKKIVFENSNRFWGNGRNSDDSTEEGTNFIGLIQAKVCFWLYYAFVDNPKLI